MSAPPVCVGMDVSKAQLDVALRPTDDCWHVSNDALGIAGLVDACAPSSPPWSSWKPLAGWRCR